MENEIALEAYGVKLVLCASDAELLPRVAALAPPGSTRSVTADGDPRFALERVEETGYRVTGTDQIELTSLDLELALGLLDAEVRFHVASHAPGLVFINAGVVAVDGRAIVLPGPALSGKTTLVAALVAAGADYYSDTYAVLDGQGLVRSYPRSLDGIELGGADEPAVVTLIALAPYRPGARWEPTDRTPGEGVLVLLGHSVPIHERPELTFHVARQAVAGARVIAGERGSAEDAAAALLGTLAAVPSGQEEHLR